MSTIQSTLQVVKSAFTLTLVGSIGLIIGLAWAQPSPAGQHVCQSDNKQTNPDDKQTVVDPDRRIFHAICLWEHRGVIRPGDVSSAGAVGPAQITKIFLKDMNLYLCTDYTLDDCKDYKPLFI